MSPSGVLVVVGGGDAPGLGKYSVMGRSVELDLCSFGAADTLLRNRSGEGPGDWTEDLKSLREIGSFELSRYELPHVYESATYLGLSLKAAGVSIPTRGLRKSPGSTFRTRMASTPVGRAGCENGIVWQAISLGYSSLESPVEMFEHLPAMKKDDGSAFRKLGLVDTGFLSQD